MRLPLIAFGLWTVSTILARAEIVSIDCSAILNARPISVLAHGEVIPWSLGIDGGGKADGFATVSAARALSDSIDHALPDDGSFPANREHPLIQLPYGNAAGTKMQARSMAGAGSTSLKLPAPLLAQLLLFFTSAEGPSQVTITLNYKGGRKETDSIEIPDYYRAPVVSEKRLFGLANNLAKWNAFGKLAEADHHYIYGWKVKADPSHRLESITLSKTAPGYLVFWGASGETTSLAGI